MTEFMNTDQEIPGWTFQIEEVSAGVYIVCGVDQCGRSIELKGSDPDLLLKQCKQHALTMNDMNDESDQFDSE